MKKEILVDAIIGAGFKSMSFACEMTDKGLARFSGNQWNEDWTWQRNALMRLSEHELESLYAKCKSA